MSAGITVTTAKLAEILGVPDKIIRKLTKDGQLTIAGRGKYALGPAIREYIESMAQSKDIKRLNEELLEEKVAVERLRRKKLELENEQTQRKIAVLARRQKARK